MAASVFFGSTLLLERTAAGARRLGPAVIVALALTVAASSAASSQGTAVASKNPTYIELCEKNLTSGRRPRLCDNF